MWMWVWIALNDSIASGLVDARCEAGIPVSEGGVGSLTFAHQMHQRPCASTDSLGPSIQDGELNDVPDSRWSCHDEDIGEEISSCSITWELPSLHSLDNITICEYHSSLVRTAS